uniref:Ferroxidase n=1 Tax=Heterorhabditis bacteriophora TaxID=37862 RepID=A0A1I7XSM5_HETBA
MDDHTWRGLPTRSEYISAERYRWQLCLNRMIGGEAKQIKKVLEIIEQLIDEEEEVNPNEVRSVLCNGVPMIRERMYDLIVKGISEKAWKNMTLAGENISLAHIRRVLRAIEEEEDHGDELDRIHSDLREIMPELDQGWEYSFMSGSHRYGKYYSNLYSGETQQPEVRAVIDCNKFTEGTIGQNENMPKV